MMGFSRKKTRKQNARKKPSIKVKKKVLWLKPTLQVSATSMVLLSLVFGVFQLNQKLSVAYWDVEADQMIKSDIEQYLTERSNKDYWHTRASVIQGDLLAEIPDIKHLEVSRILPDGLWVKAVARQPLALWECMDEKSVLLVDESGQAYRELERGESLDLPILRLSQKQLKPAIAVLQQLKQLSVEKINDLSEVIVQDQQWRLNFAHGEQWQMNQFSLVQDTRQVLKILATPRWSRGHWRMDARMPQRWFIRPAKQEVI